MLELKSKLAVRHTNYNEDSYRHFILTPTPAIVTGPNINETFNVASSLSIVQIGRTTSMEGAHY